MEQGAARGLAIVMILAVPYAALYMLAALLAYPSGRYRMTDPLEGTVMRLGLDGFGLLLAAVFMLCVGCVFAAGGIRRLDLAHARRRALDVHAPGGLVPREKGR